MRACRCVSERRSRASAEVIGQYQSQSRDNHSPAMRLADACVHARVCVNRASARACVIVAKLIIFRASSLPAGVLHRVSQFSEKKRERERERERERPFVIGFARDSPKNRILARGTRASKGSRVPMRRARRKSKVP
jgi:hypothetical protein